MSDDHDDDEPTLCTQEFGIYGDRLLGGHAVLASFFRLVVDEHEPGQ